MLKRTNPAVSFSASHRALYLRSTRPVLGGDLHSSDRFKAAWGDMPFTMINWATKDKWAYDWRVRYELGLRDDYMLTKCRSFLMYCVPIWAAGMFYAYYTPFIYLIIYDKPPEYLSREGGPKHAWEWYGKKVWCHDGKFRTGLYHINPPMFTISAEEVAEMKANGSF